MEASPLDRQPGTGSSINSRSVSRLSRNDGHKEDHLNCVGLRHGWTRTFSISPAQVSTLDYFMLETILELPTLKLRASSLRIFVENPPNSDIWSKIRFWKDDGSLQSVLVKQFFQQRLDEGVITKFEIRDGQHREDTMSILSGMGGSRMLTKPGQAKEWLKRRNIMNKSTTSVNTTDGLPEDEDEDGGIIVRPPPPQPTSRMHALMYAIGVSSTPPAPPTPQQRTSQEIAQEAHNEEETLRKRGWVPPVVRRMTSRKVKSKNSSGTISSPSSNPFFSRSERSLTRSRSKDHHQSVPIAPLEEDAQEINAEELALMNEHSSLAAKNAKENAKGSSRWLRFLGGESNRSENPFLGPKEKGKGKAFQGAELISKPHDAFDKDHSAVNSTNGEEDIDP